MKRGGASDNVAMAELPAPTSRVRQGRWLGGVCAGLATRWDVPVARLRGAFVLASLFAGLGVVVYAAAWLILPAEGENGAAAGQRGIVLLAQACGTLLGLGVLGVLGAVATVFGFGWIVVALAGAVLVGTLAGWARLGPAWALLPIGALVLPSVALAVGGVRIEPSTTSVTVAPRVLAELPGTPLRSGLGMLEVDLRKTQLPTSGTIPLRIDAGVRRTLVALPHDRCVHVQVILSDAPLAIRAGLALLGEASRSTPDSTVFGDWGTGVTDGGDARQAPGPDAAAGVRVLRRRARRARLSRRRRSRLQPGLAGLSRLPGAAT